jgi:uncharacterized protein (TIGR02246 family)
MKTMIFALALLASTAALASPDDDKKAVAALDTRYQAAVKANDAGAMAKILAPDFALVVGSGRVFAAKDLLDAARNKLTTYQHQEEEPGSQTVRVWGDTAVVTAKLWLVGKTGDKPFNRKLWFSDTYHRGKDGWRYVFGQASLALPDEK